MTFVCTPEDEDFYENEGVCCPRCMGQGSVNCYCGGDQCYCQNGGDMDCPTCLGECEVSEEHYAAYMRRQREAMAVFHGASFNYPHEKGGENGR